MDEKEIYSLVALLDDNDQEVLEHVESKLFSLGTSIIPLLELQSNELSNSQQKERLKRVIHNLHYAQLLKELKTWFNTPEHDLITGVCLIARYRYPKLNSQDIINQIDQLRLDIWLDMHYELSPYEKVKVINNVLYNEAGFKGNLANYHAPENSFINDVLASKKGNPIMLAVVFILIGQRLHLPIFGVNLPQHFVCAYKEEKAELLTNDPFNFKSKPDYREGRVLFYINPYNKGAVFSKANLELFIKQLKITPQPDYYEACSNLSIIKRILRNLVVSYEKQKDTHEANEVKDMLLALGESYFSYNEESQSEEEE